MPEFSPVGLTDAISWTDTDDTASTMNGRDGCGGGERKEGRERGLLGGGRSCLVCSPLGVLGNLLILRPLLPRRSLHLWDHPKMTSEQVWVFNIRWIRRRS